MNRVAVGLLLLVFAAPGRAADPLPKELALVPNDALAFASVNVTEATKHPALRDFLDAMRKSPAETSFQGATGLSLNDLARATIIVPVPRLVPGARRVPPPQPVFVLSTAKPYDAAAILKAGEFYSIDEAKAIKEAGRGKDSPPPSGKVGAAYYVSKKEIVLAFVDERTLAIAPIIREPGMPDAPANPKDRFKSAEPTGKLTDGIALAATKPLAFSLNMSAVRQIAEVEPVPNEATSLLKADSVVGSIALEKDAAKLHVVAGFAGKQWAADAQETATALKTLAALGLGEEVKVMRRREGDDSAMAKVLVLLAKTMNAATVKQADNDVVIAAAFDLGAESAKLLANLPGTASEAANRAKSMNNLKQIALAFHSYTDFNNAFPTNTYDKAGKPLLSWRVHLLPYLEQAPLYNEFKLDEPWDSEHNKKLIAKIPPTLVLPGVKTKDTGHTHYRAFQSAKNQAPSALMREGGLQRLNFASITDGTSNTIFCFEADESCVWTEPNDIPFDPKGKIAIKGGLLVKDRFQAALCDGSVRSFNVNMPEATLKAYITVNGGEVIDDR
ncbi:MAG: DUF1559 domain-containing protein [Gemmataceae bacterium]|nr:DUF1559 domain-containing protein [Gemmataceae bacterium]